MEGGREEGGGGGGLAMWVTLSVRAAVCVCVEEGGLSWRCGGGVGRRMSGNRKTWVNDSGHKAFGIAKCWSERQLEWFLR